METCADEADVLLLFSEAAPAGPDRYDGFPDGPFSWPDRNAEGLSGSWAGLLTEHISFARRARPSLFGRKIGCLRREEVIER